MPLPRIFSRPAPGYYPAKADCLRKRLSASLARRYASARRSSTALREFPGRKAAVNCTVGYRRASVAVGDFNGEGKLDLELTD